MSAKLRVGIPLIGGKGWLGGVSYVENLIKALRMLPPDESPLIYLVVRPNMVEELELHEHLFPLVNGIYSVAVNSALLPSIVNFNDCADLGEAVDFLFPVNSDVVNEICSASWIPDFQHVHLPHLFSKNELATRDSAFLNIAQIAKFVVFSSSDAANDFHKLYPFSNVITKVLHFHTLPSDEWFQSQPLEVVEKYNLPDRFILCCNQFWSHKNHALLFRALAKLIESNQPVHLVCTGATTDYRSADYFNELLHLLQELNIQEYVHIMGTLPRNDQIQLMRQALAVVQPSLFEGWSTVVEDARALGKTLVLSDLAVHYEQNPGFASFFNRQSIDSLQTVLSALLPGLLPGPNLANEETARDRSIELSLQFARNFMAIAREACVNLVARALEEGGRRMIDVKQLLRDDDPSNSICIATSVSTKNIDLQKRAIASWRHHGFHVVSVNIASEIDMLRPNFPGVDFVEVQRYGREGGGQPMIFLDDVFAVLKASSVMVCGIINPDIHLRPDVDLHGFIMSEAKGSLISCHRYDVENLSLVPGKPYLNGYDFFFFDKSILEKIPLSTFYLGSALWDVWVPLAAFLKGVRLKRCIAALGFHIVHQNHFDEKEWLQNCVKLVDNIFANDFNVLSHDNFLVKLKKLYSEDVRYGLFKLFRDYISENSTLVAPIQLLPDGVDPSLQNQFYLVTAIVSTYNADKFFRGCIENLLKQSLYKKGLLEIIIINSGSQQDEERVAEYYLETHDHIIYRRTERETLYAAWNRGVNLARGKYITHANTDDRHHLCAFEKMAHVLETHNVGLVYVDAFMTTTANETFDFHSANKMWLLPDFNVRQALLDCPFGCQVMWKAAVHNDVGMFDPSYKRAGDYEFFLRVGLKTGALHLPEVLALYHESPNNLSYQSPEDVIREVNRFIGAYRRQLPLESIYPYLQHDSSPVAMAAALVDFANYLMGIGGFLFTDSQLAEELYRQASEILPGDADILGNLIVACIANGKNTEACSIVRASSSPSPRLAYYAQLLLEGKLPELTLTCVEYAGLSTMHPVKKAHEIRVPWGRPVMDRSLRTVIIDGVIFQLQHGRPFGISRMWLSLLLELGAGPLAMRIILLDRVGTAPQIPGIQLRRIPAFSYGDAQREAAVLDDICREENAELFLTTYYTYTNVVPSLLMLYDMIPERFETVGPVDAAPAWRDKYHAIMNSNAYAAISQSTAGDLATFYPLVAQRPVTIVPCAVSDDFKVHSVEEIATFKKTNGIDRPYFLLVGRRDYYKNAKLFFQAFSRLPDRGQYAIVMAGGGESLESELRDLAGPAAGYAGFFVDRDLSLAYSGALALVYPSLCEGFGLPILEAMQSGCPVITCQNSSLPEVAGSAALYVGECDVDAMSKSLLDVQDPDVRAYLIKRGVERARQFSWQKSAARLVQAMLEAMNVKG